MRDNYNSKDCIIYEGNSIQFDQGFKLNNSQNIKDSALKYFVTISQNNENQVSIGIRSIFLLSVKIFCLTKSQLAIFVIYSEISRTKQLIQVNHDILHCLQNFFGPNSQTLHKTVHIIVEIINSIYMISSQVNCKMTESQGLSKREQKKLEQTLRLFERADTLKGQFQSKPRKKRKTHDKIIKINPREQQKDPKNQFPEMTNETKQPSQFNSTPLRYEPSELIKLNEMREFPLKPNFLNQKYEGQFLESLADSFMNYQYHQMEKQLQKQASNFNKVDQIGTPLEFKICSASFSITKKYKQILQNYLELVGDRPFSKAHQSYCNSMRISKNR